MTPQFWIGFGFLAALVLFLMYTVLRKDTLTSDQYKTMRFLCALCAGFAGGFLTGEALFRLDSEIAGGTKLAISGTAGIGLFFTVWFTYGKVSQPPLKDYIIVSIPEGWTFEAAARKIVEAAGGIIHFDGFQPQQLNAQLPATPIEAPSAQIALLNLGYQLSSLPPYRVDFEHGVYHLRA